MPIYNATLTHVDINETRRYAGLMRAADFPNHLLLQACTEAHLLAKPKGIWQIFTYDADREEILSSPPLPLTGKKITRHLENCSQVAVLAVTIGEDIEHAVSQHFTDGTYSAGMLLDAAGTTAVEAVADQLSAVIIQQAAKQGCETTFRFSPGYGDWDVRVQPELLAIIKAHKIDLTVTDTCMLVPRKSVTAVIGLMPNQSRIELPALGKETGCAACDQLNCSSRKPGQE